MERTGRVIDSEAALIRAAWQYWVQDQLAAEIERSEGEPWQVPSNAELAAWIRAVDFKARRRRRPGNEGELSK